MADSKSRPTKPPFSYYGGKQRLAPKIIELLPPHMVYVEPYAGSAAVMFRKGLPDFTDNDHYIEVINDLNGEVINFFRVMQDHALRIALIDRLVWTPHHEEEHRLAQERTGDSPVDRAWDFYIDLQLSFARSMGHRFAISKAKGKSSVFRNAVDGLGLFRERLRYCTIHNRPALDVIKAYDSPVTCFYVDPPYPEAFQGHYAGFTQADFESLIDVLAKCQGAVLLSCYDNPAVPAMWEKHEFGAFMSAFSSGSPNRRRTEVVWVKPATGEVDPKSREIAQKNWLSLREQNAGSAPKRQRNGPSSARCSKKKSQLPQGVAGEV